MAKQRYINTKFWDDSYISNLDPSEKLIFLYCLTNPCTNISGAYEIPLKRIAFDTGFDCDMLLKIFSRFERDDKIIYKDNWIVILNFIKHQNTQSNTVITGINENLKNSPEWVKHTLSIRYPYGIIYLDLNLNLNLDLDDDSGTTPKHKVNNKLTVPSLNEILSYISEQSLSVDGTFFLKYYTESNWIDSNGKKVINWKLKLLTWDKQNKTYGQKPAYKKKEIEWQELEKYK